MTNTRKTQKLLLYIADEVIRICEKHNISYVIIAGTLLGSVRHKGFIPWDDDFDIGMTRSEYERFLEVCPKELDPDVFFLQTSETEKNFAYCLAKVQLLGTEVVEDFSLGVDIHHGLFVDIFPYDVLPKEGLHRKIYLFRNQLLKTMLWIKCGYGVKDHSERLGYKILKLIGKFVSIESLKNRRYRLLTKYSDKAAEDSDCFTGDYLDELVKQTWLIQKAPFEFEGRTYQGIKDADGYLSDLYGDYMQLPPEEKRVTHTSCEIDYGKYESELEENDDEN